MFYVDADCIACDTCSALAPAHFSLAADHSIAVVKRQPGTDEERRSCGSALDACPVGAIKEAEICAK
jgi:ferredoxin